ncbi:MAG TPA: hypothetical protein DCE44_19015 [Verrucomicrobiales bacterium]|nr:hypothetical protein [Verrucomicrobiales bacterium]
MEVEANSFAFGPLARCDQRNPNTQSGGFVDKLRLLDLRPYLEPVGEAVGGSRTCLDPFFYESRLQESVDITATEPQSNGLGSYT